MLRVGMLTSGGDCQALNAAMRGVAKSLYEQCSEVEIYGFEDGYRGLVREQYHVMKPGEFSGILNKGGTILGTSRMPFKRIHEPDECLCLVKKQNQNTSIDSSLPLFRSLKELAKICYNFQNSRTFDVAKPLYIMKGGLERYGFGRTI